MLLFSLYGETWLGLNDAEKEGVFVWAGTDLPYNWAPESIENGNSTDYVFTEDDFDWDVSSGGARYVVCQNISGTAARRYC